jgi:hypothetical protein
MRQKKDAMQQTTIKAPPASPPANGLGLSIEGACSLLEGALRQVLTSPEDKLTLEVRRSLHFFPQGGSRDDSIEILARDRIAAVTRKSVELANRGGTLPSLAQGIKDKFATRRPHHSETFGRLSVLREEVNTLWGILRASLPGGDLAEVQGAVVEGFGKLFPDWQDRATTASHYSVIRKRLSDQIAARLQGLQPPREPIHRARKRTT